jgi:hypothetical protein
LVLSLVLVLSLCAPRQTAGQTIVGATTVVAGAGSTFAELLMTSLTSFYRVRRA